MLVFYAPTKVDFLIVRCLAVLGLSVHIFDQNKVAEKKFFSGTGNIFEIEFLVKDKIGLMKLIDFLPRENINRYLSSLCLDKIYPRISKFYKCIDMLDQKLNLSLVSSFEYHSAGLIYAYYLNNRTSKSQRLYIINCDVKSFITQEYQIFDKRCVHVMLPIGQSISTFYRFTKSSITRILVDKADIENDIKERSILERPGNNVAVFFHKSDSYGLLYKKHHYFSGKRSSLLHWDNVVRCAIFPDKNTPSHLTPLRAQVDKVDLIKFFSVIDPMVFLRSSIPEKRAQIILFHRYLEYRAWVKVFNAATLKNVIIDYDCLFPKSLSLALEHLGIKTFALQERPTTSMYHMTLGVICDVYAYSGELWRSYGNKNKSIICKKSVNFSSWRNTFFLANSVKIQDMKFHREVKNGGTRKKIVFLGYFLSSHSPITSFLANKQFFEYVNIVAREFADSSVFIRMKDLDKELYQNMLTEFSNTANVYISTNYDADGVSYALCRDADAIVSVQTSLAEEALAFGKSVILIDDMFTVNKICTDIYPPDFNFLIARSSVDVVSLIRKIFSLDQELLASYGGLKKSLSANYMLKRQADIPRAIESMFTSGSNVSSLDT